MEVAYVTSSGSTVTRKAAWTGSLPLAPGRHLLIANSLGIYAAQADATYSGGLAATGGVIVVRPTGGTPVDAVGWGDAVNAFVEGSAAPPPAAGRSIERGPGGTGGNTSDTNDNASDFVVNAAPVAQNLAAAPAPGPSPSPPTPRRRHPGADAGRTAGPFHRADTEPDPCTHADRDSGPTPTDTPIPPRADPNRDPGAVAHRDPRAESLAVGGAHPKRPCVAEPDSNRTPEPSPTATPTPQSRRRRAPLTATAGAIAQP